MKRSSEARARPALVDPKIAQLSALLEHAPVPSFILDLEGRIVFVNGPGADLIQRSRFDCEGFSLAQVVYPPDLDEARWKAEGLLEGKCNAYQTEHRFVDAGGRCFWVRISLSVLKDDCGRPQYLWLQALDIDHQRRTEEALAQSDRRWNFALESAGQGVWEADLVSDTVYYSPTWRKLRGIGPDEHVDSSQNGWLARVHPQDHEKVRAHFLRSHDLPRSVFEYRERHRLGHYIWIQSRGAPVEFSPSGMPTRIVGTDTDVTELKKVEAQNRGLAKRLELALSVSKIGVFETNLRTGQINYDSRLRKIFGLADDGTCVTPEKFAAALHPDDAAEILAANNNVAATRGSFASSFRIIRPDGQIRTLKSHAAYYEDEDGTPNLIGTNWDISEEVEIKESLLVANQLAEVRYAELEIAKQRIERLALLDPLTGLPNRRYLDEVLARFAADAVTSLAVLHIDLDHFKQINDNFGHATGDAVLRHVAGYLKNAVPPDSFVARVGGDEFVVLVRDESNAERLGLLANSICRGLSQPFNYLGNPCRVGASIGIGLETGAKLEIARLLVDADAALYRAKQSGRGQCALFTDTLRMELHTLKRTAEDLVSAIERCEFFPFYQPLVDAKTFALVGVEALARWQHPLDGILPPARFLGSAEQLQLLGKIDSIILEKAIEDMNDWREGGIVVPSVSVNISFGRLKDDKLLSVLSELSFPWGTVNFELLESIFLDNEDDGFSANIEGLKHLGIGIDIDDFGTGHTSFLSLFRLQPRRFKIDRQLITPITKNAEQRKIVGSIIGIGKTLGIKVVAEGVETIEQAEILRRLGCDYLQGYAFAKPMQASDLIQWIKCRRHKHDD